MKYNVYEKFIELNFLNASDVNFLSNQTWFYFVFAIKNLGHKSKVAVELKLSGKKCIAEPFSETFYI